MRIGLTGGIGSGKSTVAALFAARGVPIIDADEIARELAEPGHAAHSEIVAAFGAGVLAPDGAIDRAALRKLAFSSDTERQRLEAILHPRIKAEMEARAAAIDAPYHIFVVPLLVEAGLAGTVDRVLVVDVDKVVQLQRVMERSKLPEAEVARIMAHQADRTRRLACADDVIRNDGDLARLEQEVEALHHRYLALAGGG